MEEVSEVEVIQMEDADIIAPAAKSTLIESTDTANDAATTATTAVSEAEPDSLQASAVLPAAPATPEAMGGHFDDEDITFHKVSFSLPPQRKRTRLRENSPFVVVNAYAMIANK